MILNGKCKEDFEKWFYKEIDQVVGEGLDDVPDLYLNALIIDFFDSVGIIILPNRGVKGYYSEIKDFNNKTFGNCKCHLVVKNNVDDFESRQQATEKAIEKANEIYNK